MIALDTDVVVRILVDDDPRQCRLARRLAERAAEADERLWLCDVVLCETVWVLESCYGLARDAIAAVLHRLARARQVALQSPDQVATALRAYATGKADFADLLSLAHARAAGCDRLVTFDEDLLAVEGTAAP